MRLSPAAAGCWRGDPLALSIRCSPPYRNTARRFWFPLPLASLRPGDNRQKKALPERGEGCGVGPLEAIGGDRSRQLATG